MGSKKYRDKTCVYCGKEKSSTTGDHVIAREFFPTDARQNLPQVPSCVACNNDKSFIEHYLLAVLPIGGRHEGAATAIADQVVPRLAKNEALVRQIEAGRQQYFVLDETRTWSSGMITPLDGSKLMKLACLIAQGLAWHHWKIQLAPEALADAKQMKAEGVRHFRGEISGHKAGEQVKVSLGNGVFQYHGAYQRTNPKKTIWEMSFFGGVEVGPINMRGESTRSVFVVTSNEREWYTHIQGTNNQG